ncbi:hypothetical protein CRUP_031669, partial [Coryphaenoides rupestris]
ERENFILKVAAASLLVELHTQGGCSSLVRFNLPKIVTGDVPIFLGLISDLFPQLDVPRKRDPRLEEAVRLSVSQLGLQPEENFILKVTQLEELLAVRHSVFVVGGPGTGKSQILKTLHRTYGNMKMKPVWSDMNPKAVTTDELFGYLHPATREWKDGLFSSTMREMTSVGHDSPKWIVLDGDIDPMWIESLNTVMDDNKVTDDVFMMCSPPNETWNLVN